MEAYTGLVPLYGDIHNHCGISYGHGAIEDAYANARERLDFFSVTGHAFWPDMPAPNERNRAMIAFHEEGFARLRAQWPHVREVAQRAAACGDLVFLGFEMHSRADGDYTVLLRDLDGDIVTADGLAELRDRLRALRAEGREAFALTQHMGYRRGHRGVNWGTYTPELSPVVEIVSMHGCSEADEAPRPFLHTMGPSDHEGTMQAGIERGHVFGVIGSTDHHSGHPGSYGHGLAGAWAAGRSRGAVWEAIRARRTWAMTGDRIALALAVDGAPMGAVIAPSGRRGIAIAVEAGGAIDHVDLLRDNRLIRRVSSCDRAAPREAVDPIRTILVLEVGWGPRNARQDWALDLGIDSGRILGVEPRFRGREVVSPADPDADRDAGCYVSRCRRIDARTVRAETVTWGNPTNTTPGTQAVALHVEMPRTGRVQGTVNGRAVDVPLARLLRGALAEPLADMPAPSFRLHRAPEPHELSWTLTFEDDDPAPGSYYARVRQANDQWAWSSPVFLRR